MKAFVALEPRFLEDSSKNVFSRWASYIFWKNYLTAFNEVCVVARFTNDNSQNKVLASGKGVLFYKLPDYHDPFEALIKLPFMVKRLWNISKEKGIFILRVPGGIGALLWIMLEFRGKPYVVEVEGNPKDVLAYKASGSILIHLIFRPLMVFFTKLQCSHALAASYVTKSYLQQKYPAKRAAIKAAVSDVILPDSILRMNYDDRWKDTGNMRIIFIGTLERPYKGVDVLLNSFAMLIRNFPDSGSLKLWIIGDGRLRKSYEKKAKRLGIGNKIQFFGNLKHDEVFEKLSHAHLFVLPSRQEGLPRAMVEAMACALPCIGTDIGGIPELLPEEALVPKNDADALCNKLRVFLSSPEKLREIGENNRRKIIEKFHPSLLRRKRKEFFLSVRKLFESHE